MKEGTGVLVRDDQAEEGFWVGRIFGDNPFDSTYEVWVFGTTRGQMQKPLHRRQYRPAYVDPKDGKRFFDFRMHSKQRAHTRIVKAEDI